MGYLLLRSCWDYKWKNIPIWILGAGAVAGMILFIGKALCFGNWGWVNSLTGLIPGLCVSALSMLTSDQIGLGDGLVLLVTGWILGFQTIIFAAVIGLFAATVFGVGLIIFKRGSLQTALPFIPFLTIGLGIAILML